MPVLGALQPTRDRWWAIVLAAGAGVRFGGGKLLAPYRGGKLIDGALHAALQAPVEGVTVVTGYAHEAVASHVETVFGSRKSGISLQVVHAGDYAEGLAASLRTGIQALADDGDGAFVFLGDMPDIPVEVPRRLAQAIGEHAAAAPAYRGVRGHPVLFRRRLFAGLATLSGDRGARSLLDDLGEDLLVLECDHAGVLFDVDRQGDLAL